jgi:hypothetical protein
MRSKDYNFVYHLLNFVYNLCDKTARDKSSGCFTIYSLELLLPPLDRPPLRAASLVASSPLWNLPSSVFAIYFSSLMTSVLHTNLLIL